LGFLVRKQTIWQPCPGREEKTTCYVSQEGPTQKNVSWTNVFNELRVQPQPSLQIPSTEVTNTKTKTRSTLTSFGKTGNQSIWFDLKKPAHNMYIHNNILFCEFQPLPFYGELLWLRRWMRKQTESKEPGFDPQPKRNHEPSLITSWIEH
jgi:hypothetical protein